jgi:DNA-binding response OmpR family regulator
LSASRRSVRVLIVEDEPATALLLEGMLVELGFDEVHIAYDSQTARDAIGTVPPDLAILDINLGRGPVTLLAEKLRALGIPIVFSSGEQVGVLAPEWSDRPLVPKPLDKRMLHAALRNLGFESN